MQTSQYEIAGYFHNFDRSLMISPPRIPPIVFSIETRIFFSQEKLYILIEYILRVQISLQK